MNVLQQSSVKESAQLRAAGLEPAQAGLVRAAVAARFDQAASHYQCEFAVPPVRFDLIGGTAGMHCVRGQTMWLRFNPWLFARYWEDSIENTVAHEVAHAVVWQRTRGRRVPPHGAAWREVMALFGADASVTCRYDLEGIPCRMQQRYFYRCECREHAISAVRHNRIRKGLARYHCRYCRGALLPLGRSSHSPLR